MRFEWAARPLATLTLCASFRDLTEGLVPAMRLNRGVKVPVVRDRRSEGTRLLEAVFPTGKGRRDSSKTSSAARTQRDTEAQRLFHAVFGRHPSRQKAVSRPGVRAGMGLPVKLQARRGGGVEAVLRREIAHSERLTANDFKRMRFLLWRAQQQARLQSLGQHKPSRRRRKVKWTNRVLAVSWHTRLDRDAHGVSLVLENRSDHALYLAMGTRYVRPRAVFKSALASQQGAIDLEWQRLARVAQMRHETRGQLRAGIKRH